MLKQTADKALANSLGSARTQLIVRPNMNIQMLKRISTVVALVLLSAPALLATVSAQSLNVGYTDHEVIIFNLPEYQQVQQQLQQEYQGSQQEIQELYQGYQESVSQYQRQQSLMTAEKRAEREQELIQEQQQIQQQAQVKDQELGQRETELMQPLLEKVQNAIDDVAQREGLDLVLRSPLVLYVNQETIQDITMAVAVELGLDVSETTESASGLGAD
jgi:outer membrane protein